MGERLLMYPVDEYPGVGKDDPIRHYCRPVFGPLYRQRLEMCLEELPGGVVVLEVGFGSGVSFPNLAAKYQEIRGLDLGVDIEQISSFWLAKGIAAELKSGSVLEMPYPDRFFDAMLLVSILEHLKPAELSRAFSEAKRVLKPGGHLVYGVPMDRWETRLAFRALGYDIRKHHFSTERDVRSAAEQVLRAVRLRTLNAPLGIAIGVYQVGHFVAAA